MVKKIKLKENKRRALKHGQKIHVLHQQLLWLLVLQLRVRPVRLHLDGDEVKFGTNVNFDLLNVFNRLFTCMNLGSGGATIGLVAEVTGLAGFTGARSGLRTRDRSVWSEK